MNCKDKRRKETPKAGEITGIYFTHRIHFAGKEYDKICILTGNRI